MDFDIKTVSDTDKLVAATLAAAVAKNEGTTSSNRAAELYMFCLNSLSARGLLPS